MRTQRLIAYAFAACLVSLLAGSAMADDGSGYSNASLKGKYRIFSNVSSDGSTAHLYFIGVITYDGNGHARMADRGTVIDSNSSTPPSSFEETGMFTYEVKRDGSFTQLGSFTSNPVGSYTITNVKWVGQIGTLGSILILSGAIPPEPTTFTDGGGSSVRYGSFTATAVRIPQE
jgi:hypothetical protein